MEKTCFKCKLSYSATSEFFFRDKSKKSGLSGNCKKCEYERSRAYKKNNPEKEKIYDKNKHEKAKTKNPNYFKERYLKTRKLASRDPLNPMPVNEKLLKLLSGAKKRALSKNIDFNLTYDFLFNLWEKQNGTCLLTGIKFDLYVSETKCYSPSIDKIDTKKGYTQDNVRLIIYAMNTGLSNWGTEVFDVICKQYYERNIKK